MLGNMVRSRALPYKCVAFFAWLAICMTCRAEVSVARFTASGPDKSGAITLDWRLSGWQEPYSVYPIGRYNVAVFRMDTSNWGTLSLFPLSIKTQDWVDGSFVDDTPHTPGETYIYWLCYAPYNKQNYTCNFASLYLNGGAEGIVNYSLSKFSGDVQVYIPKPAVVTFHANEGTGEMESQEFWPGTVQELAKNQFERNGFDFSGWASSPEIAATGGVEYADMQTVMIESDIDLYAVWKEGYNLKATTDREEAVVLTWHARYGHEGEKFWIYRSRDYLCGYEEIAIGVSTTSYTDTSCVPGVDHNYYVMDSSGIPSHVAVGRRKGFDPDFNVVSKYFDGKYGGSSGRKATFLNGIPCAIEMTVQYDGSRQCHWLVNGCEFTERTFTVDVGAIEVGGKLEVVAMDMESGARSEPYRLNFDVAEQVDPDPGHKGLWTASPSNSEGIDEIVYAPIGSGSVAFPLAQEKNGSMPKFLSWLPGKEWSFNPTIKLEPEVRSGGNGCWTFFMVDDILGTGTDSSNMKASHKRNRRAVGKLAHVLDKEVGITLSGGPLTFSWNPQKRTWVAEDISIRGEVSGSLAMTHHYPTPVGPVFLEGKEEVALEGAFKVSGLAAGRDGLDVSFTVSSERLPKITVAGGYGINNVAYIKGAVSGLSVFNLMYDDGEWRDFRWGIRLQGALIAKAFVLETTLLEITSETCWFINHTVPKSARLMSGLPSSDLEWQLQSRDYLGNVKPRARLLGATPSADGVVESGGYPDPTPAMASGMAGDALAYLRDDGSRTSANRTELVVRTGANNEWSAAESVWNDGTADFMPSLVAMPDGSFAVAWMNTSRTFSDDVTINEYSEAMEIAVGVRDAATGTWTCRNLTADSAFDFAPVVRAAANGKILVVWLRNASGRVTSSPAEPTDIMASIYANGAWSAPTAVLNGVGIVNGFDVAFNGASAVLAFSKDADGDPSTLEDAEIYATRLDGQTWGSPIQLTCAGDANGRPFVRAEGGSFPVLWTADGTLMETRELALSNAVAVAAAEGWELVGDLVMIRGANGRDAFVWNDHSAAGGAADAPMAMEYDPGCGAWGSPVKLFDDERRERRLSGAIGMDGRIRIGYESSSVATNTEGEVTFGDVELRTRFFSAACDLAVVEDGFSFSTNEFVNGESIDLTVKASNLGFRSATNVTVKVYEGSGNEKSVLASVVTNFPGGGVVAFNVPWTVDTTQANLQFTVEVDAGEEEDATAKGNNVYVWSAGVYDVAFRGVMVRNESATRRRLTANIANSGLGPLPAGGKVVFRRGGEDGEVLGEDTLGIVWPGADRVSGVDFAWDMSGISFTSVWETVCVQLYPEGTAEEMADMAFVKVMTTLGPTNVVVYAGRGKTVTVPGTWLENISGRIDAAKGDLEAALQSRAANGLSMWECYLLGLDPEINTNGFRITSFPMKEDGTPDLERMMFEPLPEVWNVPAAYEVKGATTPSGPWMDVPIGGDPSYRFFRVELVLP